MLVAQIDAVAVCLPIILFQLAFVLPTVLVAQHEAVGLPVILFQFEFAVHVAAASVGADSEHQHGD